MSRRVRSPGLPLWLAGLASVAGCGGSATVTTSMVPALTLVEVGDTELERVTLSETALRRLGIATVATRTSTAEPGRSIVPHSAVIYDSSGRAWAYVEIAELTFVRQALRIERIVAEEAILSEGPAVGSLVVSVGAAELYGAETGVGGGH